MGPLINKDGRVVKPATCHVAQRSSPRAVAEGPVSPYRILLEGKGGYPLHHSIHIRWAFPRTADASADVAGQEWFRPVSRDSRFHFLGPGSGVLFHFISLIIDTLLPLLW